MNKGAAKRKCGVKKITIVVAESMEFHDVVINTHTTVQEILGELGLPGAYELHRGHGTAPLCNDENVYSAVPDRTKLYAATRPCF